MGGMKRSIKVSLIVVVLALAACLVWLVSRPEDPAGAGLPDAPRGPGFEVRVEKPRLARPLFGIIPAGLEEKLFGGGYLRFDHASPGAQVGGVGPDRLELRADRWDLLVEADGGGGIARGTRLVFPILLAERQRTLRCRPAEPAVGYLRAAARPGADLLDGQFLVELAACENTETGKTIEWPPAPLTVRGSFAGLPRGPR